MPVVVNTELGSGLHQTRGFKPVEAEDVANAIIDALQTGRYEVYVPKSIGTLFRAQAFVPRRASEAMARVLKGDQVLAQPDHAARAAYEARVSEAIAATGRQGEAGEAAADAGTDVQEPEMEAA
jgi:hypothetical protein